MQGPKNEESLPPLSFVQCTTDCTRGKQQDRALL